ncbi:MAG TPA: hypothetical protein VGI79_09515 [Caulobacteraceae bacterium]|jgi:hypothetical protein
MTRPIGWRASALGGALVAALAASSAACARDVVIHAVRLIDGVGKAPQD